MKTTDKVATWIKLEHRVWKATRKMHEIEKRNNRLRKINLCTKTCELDYQCASNECAATILAEAKFFTKEFLGMDF